MSNDRPRIPVRSKERLEEWLADYLATGVQTTSTFKVAAQDGSDGNDTGLLIMRLVNATAEIYMEPAGHDDAEWVATLTAGDDDITLPATELGDLAAELAVAGRLCAYLQFRSIEWDRMSGMR